MPSSSPAWNLQQRGRAQEIVCTLGFDRLSRVCAELHVKPVKDSRKTKDQKYAYAIITKMGTGSPEKLLSKMSVSHADLNNFFRKCADPEKVRKKNVQKAKVADLKSWAASYILDGWQGNFASEVIEEHHLAEVRNELAGLEEVKNTATLFNEASRKQIEAFLKGDRMRASDLKRMCKTLKIDTLASGKTELANRILAEEALHRPGGPSKLVNSMDKEELKAFLDEHWKQIEELNDCTKENDNCGYGDRSKFDKVACTHFILWAWEHMPTA